MSFQQIKIKGHPLYFYTLENFYYKLLYTFFKFGKKGDFKVNLGISFWQNISKGTPLIYLYFRNFLLRITVQILQDGEEGRLSDQAKDVPPADYKQRDTPYISIL